MPKYITIFVNGNPFNCDLSMSILDVLVYLSFDVNNVVVEYNNCILDTHAIQDIYMVQHDSVEVITIVGGG